MLRLANPLPGHRIGGWAAIESPPQRVATGGQHWSLLILLAAAMVAIMSVAFDLRIGSSPEPRTTGSAVSAVGLASDTSGLAGHGTAIEQQGSLAEASTAAVHVSSADSTGAQTDSAPVAGSATSRPSSSAAENRAALDASPKLAATGEAGQAVALAETSGATAEEGVASAQSGGELLDAASRIREYLGLHPGAQLPVSFSYEVQAGDTASSIARRFGLDEATVLFNNFDIYDADHLTVGQILQLPPVDGLVYTVQPGDTLDRLELNYLADSAATVAFPANGIASPDQIQVGQQLLLVHGSASLSGAATASASSSGGGQAAQVWSEPTFVWPLGPDGISDPFGTPRANAFGYHTGVDFVAPMGTIVGATAGGQVTVATWDPSYGNWVEISHGGGYRSRYAHLDEIWVREGEWVQSNAYIGTVGNTGNSSGAHLHFEIIINGQAVNPLAWLN
ncbi:MAG: peptidoglycan DD-metalloendopeptidase family protein [Chloroflexi bacterium]|nr:peptidoglycan DD-metalloendopeptidase family protein [Chloroflexota bacterium]